MLETDDEARERREAIKNNPYVIRRLGAMGIHRMGQFIGPGNIRSLYELPYRMKKIEVIGRGFNATAYRYPGEDTVIKLIRGSNLLDDDDRLELAEYLRDLIEINATTHPGVSVKTDVIELPSPILGHPAVQLVQPYVLDIDRVDPRQVIDFAEKSLEEMMPLGFLPDVAGRNNLVGSDDGLKLVDTVPIESTNEGIYGMCKDYLLKMAHLDKRC